MSKLQRYCMTVGQRLMAGLAQTVKIKPYQDYVPRGLNAARVFSLRLAGINPAHLPKIRGMQDQLTMWAGLDQDHQVLIGWDGHGITIEVPKPREFWQKVTIEQMESRHFFRRGPIATLGLGLQEEPCRINFQESTTAHVLIAGQTRSGKTSTQRLIAWNLARNSSPVDNQLLILDVAKKGYRWSDFANVIHLAHPLVTELEEAERVLLWLTMEIERRGEQQQISPRLFVFIDELKALVSDSNVADKYLARIAEAGGEFGLHLIMATQYPQIQMLEDTTKGAGASIKRNVGTRLCGRVDDNLAAKNTLGIPDSGAQYLQGFGDFLLRDFDGLRRLTVAKLEPYHVEQLSRGERHSLTLPAADEIFCELPRPRNQPDPYEPEQVAQALFEPNIGINRLAKMLNIGNTKATRVKEFAQAIRTWGLEQGYTQLILEPHQKPQDRPRIIRHWTQANGNHNGADAPGNKNHKYLELSA